jgi:hypothetical protein
MAIASRITCSRAIFTRAGVIARPSLVPRSLRRHLAHFQLASPHAWRHCQNPVEFLHRIATLQHTLREAFSTNEAQKIAALFVDQGDSCHD